MDLPPPTKVSSLSGCTATVLIIKWQCLPVGKDLLGIVLATGFNLPGSAFISLEEP